MLLTVTFTELNNPFEMVDATGWFISSDNRVLHIKSRLTHIVIPMDRILSFSSTEDGKTLS